MHNPPPDAALTDPLLQALGATRGTVCLVGAGGKKSTLYALAARHPGRVALSSTAHMYRYDEQRVDQVLTVTAGLPPAAAADARVVAYCTPTATPARVGGLTEAQLAAIATGGAYDLVLIKGDGARARWIKAPAAHEPSIPAWVDTVIPVISARVLGRRLDSGIAHRPERAAAVMGVALDAPLTAGHLARLLCAADGALKGVGNATVVPLLNMVDDSALADGARTVARLALAGTTRFDRVVLARMKDGCLVEVVRR